MHCFKPGPTKQFSPCNRAYMEASMTGFLVSTSTGAMNLLLCKLGTLLGDEYKLLKGVRRQIEILRDELSSMNSLLKHLAEVDELDVQRKEWRNKVCGLAYDIEDCIDIFMHQHCHNSDGDAGFICKAIRKVRKLRARHRIALQIRELKSRVMEEGARRDRYKLDVPTSSRRLMDVDPRLPAFYTEATSLVGIDSPRDEILRWLTDENWKCCFAGHVNVVSIMGFGGIGKTTLANQVYRKIRDGFQCTAFVSVSQNPDMAKVLRDILSQIGSANRTSGCNDVQGIIEKIREHLSQKRYLIVVDDIWSIQVWDIIRCAFINNSNQSRVITTTRNEKIAAVCCSYCYNHIYKMKPLSDHHSRKLFFQRVFGSEDDCPEQYKNVSERILKKYRGVPLMIICIASLLASQECMCKWESIQKSLVFELETSPTLGWMRHVLNLSYNDLSHSLKTCFLYLGVYPEDYKIEKANLLRRWIAEGFVDYQHGLSPEEVAESFFNELINRSMIQPAGFEYGELTYCLVHDIMCDFILSQSTEENFITTIMDQRHKTKGASEVRRLSFQIKNNHFVPTGLCLSRIRSRTIFGWQYVEGMNYLLRFELLRVLDLYCDRMVGTEVFDVSAVGKLFQLRFLRIDSYQINMPKKLGN